MVKNKKKVERYNKTKRIKASEVRCLLTSLFSTQKFKKLNLYLIVCRVHFEHKFWISAKKI